MNIFEQTVISPKAEIEQGLLFFGNQHETVPTRLLYDPYLTPRAKFAWQLIKHKAREFQGGLFPSYELLSKLLSDKPYANASLSRKTVSQTLLLLRLTRWLTLCETVRNEHGQVKGNVYLLHDEPIPILDAIQLNEDYLALLHSAIKHKDNTVKQAALHILENIMQDKTQWHYVSHIDWMKARYQDYCARIKNQKSEELIALNLDTVQQNLLSSNKELSEELSLKGQNLPSSLMEPSQISLSSNREFRDENIAKPLILDKVPSGDSANMQYKYSTVLINKYCTGVATELDWEQLKLNALDKQVIAKSMQGLDLGLCQAILFEASQRLAMGGLINKPSRYVFSLVRKAHRGEFNPYLLEQHLQKNRPQKSLVKDDHQSAIPGQEQMPVAMPSLQERKARAEAIRNFRLSLIA